MKRLIIGLLLLIAGTLTVNAQLKENFIDSMSLKIGDIKEEIVKIQDNYYMIQPYGLAGNIGVFISDTRRHIC